MNRESDIQYFCERSEYSVLENRSLVELFSDWPEAVNIHEEKFVFKITGFFIHGNKIITVFPKGYFPRGDKQKDAATLLRVLLRYRNSRNLEPEEVSMLRGNLLNRNGRLASAISLMDDYQKNGNLRRNVIAKSAKSNGFTDWNRTVKTSVPVISNKRPVYINPVMRSTVSDNNNIICRIHKSVIAECFSMFGWLYGNSYVPLNTETLPCPVNEAISLLKTELRNTFSQREIAVIKLLVGYLSARSGGEQKQNIELLATPCFHNTWEAICGHVFENQYNVLKEIVPQPEWKNGIVKGAISQRPDILYIYNDVLYILDAKFYDYRKTLPGWHDVVKQFFYKLTIEQHLGNNPGLQFQLSNISQVYNIFVFPENSSAEMLHLGDVSVQHVEDLGDIFAFAINTRQAMTAYAYRKSLNYRQQLVSEIKKACGR